MSEQSFFNDLVSNEELDSGQKKNEELDFVSICIITLVERLFLS